MDGRLAGVAAEMGSEKLALPLRGLLLDAGAWSAVGNRACRPILLPLLLLLRLSPDGGKVTIGVEFELVSVPLSGPRLSLYLDGLAGVWGAALFVESCLESFLESCLN